MRSRSRSAGVCVLAALLSALPLVTWAQDAPLVASRYRPDLRFRTISTGRFDIHFHQGEELLAARLARLVEQVAPEVERRVGTPTARVHIVLVDQTDLSNGWATVVPYNLIEIAAVPPAARSVIGNSDDWLRLVFTHEYTHIVHLEKSSGWFGGLRRIFGRMPAFYPNLFLPDWQIEGIATYQESAITRQGRVPAGDFRMMLDRAAVERRFPPLDRATGAVIDWPGGTSAYLFGAYFNQYLAERFGPESLHRLADATARRLPFTGSRAYREVYGTSLGDLWKAFAVESSRKTAEPENPVARTRLTTHGFDVGAPAFADDGRLFYSVANPHGFPALMELREGRAPTRVASRYLGARAVVAGRTLVFDQLEFFANVGLRADLYARDLDRGRTRRLTRGARAADPDVTRDGRTIICTVQERGRRILATIAMPVEGRTGVPTPLVSEDATEFSWPRWSPDARSIAAERRRLGGPSEIVVIDAASREVRSVVTIERGRAITPAWLDDGVTVLFSTDRNGMPFTLHAVDTKTGIVRRLAGAGVGAHSPAVSPDRRQLVFVGYSADGEDLYSLPFDNPTWVDVSPDEAVTSDGPSAAPAAPQPRDSRAYSPLGTLTPRFWIPYFEAEGDDTVIGAATGGFDALGRHTYSITAGWAVPRNRADVQIDYAYTRWLPALFAAYSDDTDTSREGYIRTRELSGGALLPHRRVRWSSSQLAAVTVSQDTFESTSAAVAARPERRRESVRLGWSFSTAKRFGYSITAEEGMSLSFVSELATSDVGPSREAATTVVGEARTYVPVWPRHAVTAIRVAGATSRGDERARRDFSAGGSGPQGNPFDVGVDAIGLIRGFDDADVFGRSAAVANLDYRLPLAWPQRGIGTLPVFLRSIHGALFVDVGHAWDDRFRSADLRRSVGGELSFDVVLGGSFLVTVASGAAWRHDPSSEARTGGAAFVRVGRAF